MNDVQSPEVIPPQPSKKKIEIVRRVTPPQPWPKPPKRKPKEKPASRPAEQSSQTGE